MKHFKDNISAKALTGRALFHLKYSRGKDLGAASTFDKMMCFSHAVRDMAVDGFIATQKQYLDQDVRRVNYLSMEYLIGKMLENNIYALGIEKIAAEALEPLNVNLDAVLALDVEAGLGNGGLGRLAACYLDSMATLGTSGNRCGSVEMFLATMSRVSPSMASVRTFSASNSPTVSRGDPSIR